MLIVESNPDLRKALVAACQSQRIQALGVACIAEIEEWPVGKIVVTDIAHLTRFWKEVGARAVVALADRPTDGIAALANGATHWLSRDQREFAHGIVRLVEQLGKPRDRDDLHSPDRPRPLRVEDSPSTNVLLPDILVI